VFIKKIFSVTELNTYLKNKIEEDGRLNNLWIKGEISNYKMHFSGHAYFVLKDAGACVRCVMFKNRASGLAFLPQNGMNVIIRGYLSVYERDGNYQVYVEEMQPDGVGALHLAFEQLKDKLEKEGLFDAGRKKALPRIPKKIGVVTSATGAAWQDIQKVIFSRYGNIHLVLAAAAVQGENAPREISRGIELLHQIPGIDVIIVGRGGGSLEELWAFNTETVARAIYASRIPVISAVGHQTDFTIVDFVADRRAATPSAAAEMVVPVKEEIKNLVDILQGRMERRVLAQIAVAQQRLAYLSKSSLFTNPERMLRGKMQLIDGLKQALERNTLGKLHEYQNRFKLLTEKMDMLSPLTTLARGYAVCRKEGEKGVVRSASQLNIGDMVEIFLAKGLISCAVKKKEEGDI